jgi:hypothetical protein
VCRRKEALKTVAERRWQVYIILVGPGDVGRKLKHLGYAEDEIDAAIKYDAEARKYNMPTNF